MPVYSTWNPSDKAGTRITLTNGDLTAERSSVSSGSWGSVRGTIGVSSGKWYWEITVDALVGSIHIGVGSSSVDLYLHIGENSTGWSYYQDGYKWNNGSGSSYGDSWTTGDIISIALDLDNGKIWFGKNGTWQNSGDPASGTNPAFTNLSGTVYAMFSGKNYGDRVTANFGASSFSYTVPSGFNSGLYEPPTEVEADFTDGVGIADQFDVLDFKGSITENSGIDDSFQASQQTIGSLTDGVGIGDTFSVQDMYAEFTDGIGINDQFASSSEGQFTDVTGISDTFEFFREIADSIQNDSGIDDSIIAAKIFYQSITDSLDISEIANVGRLFNFLTENQLTLVDVLKWTWLKTISDSLTIEDAIDVIAGVVISEWLFFAESQNVQWKGTESASSILTLVDDPKAAKVFSDLLADGFSISDIAKSLVGIILKEKLVAGLTLTSTGKFQQDASDAIKFTDALPFGWDKVISDSFTVTDSQVLQWLLLNVLDDQITISDTGTLLKVIPKSVTDSIQLSSSVLLQQLLFSLVADTLGFSVSIELDGELWECWVLNSSKFHPSVYSGYDFNSYAVYNNTAYGCKSDGIYELSGDTDNGAAIKNGMILPETGFGSARYKRFRKAYFGISGSSPSIKIETESGNKTFSISNAKASISRDLKGKNWTLTVADFDDLDFIEIIPIILTR